MAGFESADVADLVETSTSSCKLIGFQRLFQIFDEFIRPKADAFWICWRPTSWHVWFSSSAPIRNVPKFRDLLWCDIAVHIIIDNSTGPTLHKPMQDVVTSVHFYRVWFRHFSSRAFRARHPKCFAANDMAGRILTKLDDMSSARLGGEHVVKTRQPVQLTFRDETCHERIVKLLRTS
jgi:hypothetical protein